MAHITRNLTWVPEVFEAAQARAKQEGVSLSAWIDQLVREALPRSVSKTLPEKEAPGRRWHKAAR